MMRTIPMSITSIENVFFMICASWNNSPPKMLVNNVDVRRSGITKVIKLVGIAIAKRINIVDAVLSAVNARVKGCFLNNLMLSSILTGFLIMV